MKHDRVRHAFHPQRCAPHTQQSRHTGMGLASIQP